MCICRFTVMAFVYVFARRDPKTTFFERCIPSQGRVVSPVQFLDHTLNCRPSTTRCQRHSPQVCRWQSTCRPDYLQRWNNVPAGGKRTIWCDRKYLLMNITKTNEVVIDFRRNTGEIHTLSIKKESEILQVSECGEIGRFRKVNTMTWEPFAYKNFGTKRFVCQNDNTRGNNPDKRWRWTRLYDRKIAPKSTDDP